MTSGRSRHSSDAGDNGGVRLRLIASLILCILALPVAFFGLIDPLEGGIALLVAAGLAVAVRLLSAVPVPRLAWVSMLVTAGVGILALALAIAGMPTGAEQVVGPDATAGNPLGGRLRILVWIYRLGVLFILAGGVVYLVRIARALRGSTQPGRHEVSR
jgi:predicted membrane channel-forming protein YqfA (hemolysin III family)